MEGWLKKQNKGSIAYFAISILALCWFLLRVIPKPQRAMYPCQRAAFPIASSFVIWAFGMISSVTIFKRSRQAFRQYKWVTGILLMMVATGIFSISVNPDGTRSFANSLLTGEPASFQFEPPSTAISDPVSIVSIIQSEKEHASEITQENIEVMVRQAIELAGGLDDLIHDGQTVVLKPNLLTFRSLPYDNQPSVNLAPGANGIVTDYRIIQAVTNIVRELNPNGQIILIEGSAVGSTRSNFSNVGWNQVIGLDSKIFLEELCDWQDKDSPALIKTSLPENKVLYTRADEPNTYYMSKVYYEADVLISLPCLKNHGATGTTGAIKNVGIGATPPPIYGWGPQDPGIPNERWNPNNGVDHGTELNRDPLHYWIHDYYLAKPVDFAIMDGLQGIEMGPGANFGSLASCQENMRLVLASRDPIALDAIESFIMGHDPRRVKYLTALHRDGAGNLDPSLIAVSGKEVHEVKKDFRIYGSGSSSKYTDFTPPDVIIRSAELSGDRLILDLAANEEICKVEISVNGIKESKIIVDKFYQIDYQFEQVPESISDIEVTVYDPFLNASKISLVSSSVRQIDQDQFNLTFYPNPAVDILHIDFKKELKNNGLLRIINSSGGLMKTLNLKPGERLVKLDISDLTTGIYFVSIKLKNKYKSKSFVK